MASRQGRGRSGGGRSGGGRSGGKPKGGKSKDLVDWSDMALPLPRKVAERIKEESRLPGPDDNVGLWLDKLIYRRCDDQDHDWELKEKYREFALTQLCRTWRSQAGADALARRRETLGCLHSSHWVEVRARINGRLLVDYGRSNAAETTVSFHPIWGVPRVPGSALKGVTRAQMELAGASDRDVEGIFGTSKDSQQKSKYAGNIVFHDAIPEKGAFELAMDVLTPHHGDYYQSKKPPGDWESPVPHTFITVVKADFIVHLAARPGTPDPEARLRAATEALATALQQSGVGAKTAAGYGRLDIIEKEYKDASRSNNIDR